jgi:REP element-mobilizing transposase RayT
MLTRRTLLRTFLLRPDPVVNAVFEYCLAEAATRFGIDLIAWLAMSNHYHAIVHDPDAKLPAFLEQFHKMVAKTLNVHHSRQENVWSAEETCVTHLVTLDDVFDKVVYVLTNPVSAHLVQEVAHWPGASSWTHMGRSMTKVRRPRKYFRKEGLMPATATLRAVAPPGLKGETHADWVARVRRAVELKELTLCKKRIEKGLTVTGRKAVLARDPFDSPSTAPSPRKLRPSLACKNAKRMKEARRVLKGFRVEYSGMLALLRSDEKCRLSNGKERLVREKPKIEFPAGTYRLRVFLGVPCARFPIVAL